MLNDPDELFLEVLDSFGGSCQEQREFDKKVDLIYDGIILIYR